MDELDGVPATIPRDMRFEVRLTREEFECFTANAERLGSSKSALVRALISLPIELQTETLETKDDKRARPFIVFDVDAYWQIAKQLRAIGYHYDHCLHALNTIASKRFLTQTDTVAYIEKALSYLVPIEEEAERIEQRFDALYAADRIELAVRRGK